MRLTLRPNYGEFNILRNRCVYYMFAMSRCDSLTYRTISLFIVHTVLVGTFFYYRHIKFGFVVVVPTIAENYHTYRWKKNCIRNIRKKNQINNDIIKNRKRARKKNWNWNFSDRLIWFSCRTSIFHPPASQIIFQYVCIWKQNWK